jgi:uroporphyrinogen-III synthase
VHKVSTKIIMRKLNDTKIFVDEVETQLREKPLRSSQTLISTIQKTKLDTR